MAATLTLPGTSGNYASASDSVAISVTGDIDVRVRCSLTDYTTASNQIVIAKYNPTGNQRSWRMFIDTTGKINVNLSSDGIAASSFQKTPAATLVDLTPYWFRFTWRASDGRLQVFTAPGTITSPVTADWSQAGTNNTASLGSLFDSNVVLAIGAGSDAAQLCAGTFYRAQVRNNVLDDGTGIVFDADFSTVTKLGTRNPTTMTESSSNAATVTANGTGWDWGSGSSTVNATMAAALGALTATGAATPKVNATLAAPLGGLSATATATPKVSATLAAPLGGLTSTALATPIVGATLAAPLGSLAASASAAVTVPVTAQALLGGLTATATAVPVVSATMQALLGSLTASATATPVVSAAMQALLGGLHARVFNVPVVIVRYFDSSATVTSSLDSTAHTGEYDGVLVSSSHEGSGP